MNRLDERHELEVTEDALQYLAERLRSRAETRAFVQPVCAARGRARAADDAWRTARAARLAAGAEVSYRDARLDAQVLRLSEELRGYLGVGCDDPQLRAILPLAPTVAMAEVGGDAQTAFVTQVLANFAQRPELARAFADHLRAIEASQAGLEQALDACAAQYQAEAQAQVGRAMALESARRMYNITHARLSLALNDAELLESFFFPLD